MTIFDRKHQYWFLTFKGTTEDSEGAQLVPQSGRLVVENREYFVACILVACAATTTAKRLGNMFLL